MNKLIIFLLLVLFSSLGACTTEDYEDNNLWAEKEYTMQTPSQTRSEVIVVVDTTHVHYNLKSSWAKVIDKAVDTAMKTDILYIDLLVYDINLANYIDDIRHSWCYECKLKALKFFYTHKMWGDTVGEADEGIALEELIENDPQFFEIWNSVK